MGGAIPNIEDLPDPINTRDAYRDAAFQARQARRDSVEEKLQIYRMHEYEARRRLRFIKSPEKVDQWSRWRVPLRGRGPTVAALAIAVGVGAALGFTLATFALGKVAMWGFRTGLAGFAALAVVIFIRSITAPRYQEELEEETKRRDVFMRITLLWILCFLAIVWSWSLP